MHYIHNIKKRVLDSNAIGYISQQSHLTSINSDKFLDYFACLRAAFFMPAYYQPLASISYLLPPFILLPAVFEMPYITQYYYATYMSKNTLIF